MTGVDPTSIENSSDILSFLPEIINISGVVVSAVVAFIVAKLQSKSAERQLDKQIEAEVEKIKIQFNAEVEKIKIQYELEQKRDNINFLNKFKLEKLTELYDLVTQHLRYVTVIINLFDKLVRSSPLDEIKNDEKNNFFKERTIIEDEHFEKGLTKQITMATNYFPILKNEWEQISSLEYRIISLYPDQILGDLTIKSEEYSKFILPTDYTLHDYLEDVQRVQSRYLTYMELIAKEIGNTMDGLEPSNRNV
nr:hypothetical protein [uncultured Trichococcus sp.]